LILRFKCGDLIKIIMKRYIITTALLFTMLSTAFSQGIPAAGGQDTYTQVITKRSEKIVAGLGITDSAKFKRVEDIIINQYRTLGTIHDARNARAKDLKTQAGDDKVKAGAEIAALDSNTDKQLDQAHTAYLSKLGAELTPDQIDEVKDAMTYRVLPITYAAYLDELPNLTDVQKAQIKAWLLEAREHAIDAESSEKKHAWFGKYKGRINNYLSKQGYDMKKAEIDWQKRIKERQEQKNNG
jgi:Spy/CpxP family protein refolding chaperone